MVEEKLWLYCWKLDTTCQGFILEFIIFDSRAAFCYVHKVAAAAVADTTSLMLTGNESKKIKRLIS
jgi:hypothetical protein